MWNERRWPHWTQRAVRLGLGSSLSSPLVVRGDSLGAVNVYATREEAFADEEERVLALFAEKASITLVNVRSHEDERGSTGTSARRCGRGT